MTPLTLLSLTPPFPTPHLLFLAALVNRPNFMPDYISPLRMCPKGLPGLTQRAPLTLISL